MSLKLKSPSPRLTARLPSTRATGWPGSMFDFHQYLSLSLYIYIYIYIFGWN